MKGPWIEIRIVNFIAIFVPIIIQLMKQETL